MLREDSYNKRNTYRVSDHVNDPVFRLRSTDLEV
jgi:hypothetical protein